MEHEISERQGKTVIAFKGDIDLDSSPAARKVLLECVGRGTTVIVDLSGIGYIDSSGVASLVESLQLARKKGSDMALAAVSPAANSTTPIPATSRCIFRSSSINALYAL